MKRNAVWPAVCLQRFASASFSVDDSHLITVVLLEASTTTGHKFVSLMLAVNKGFIGTSYPQIYPVRSSLLNFEIIYCVFWPSGEPCFTFVVYSSCQRLTADGVGLTGRYLLRKQRWVLAHTWKSGHGKYTHTHTVIRVEIHSSLGEPSDCLE